MHLDRRHQMQQEFKPGRRQEKNTKPDVIVKPGQSLLAPRSDTNHEKLKTNQIIVQDENSMQDYSDAFSNVAMIATFESGQDPKSYSEAMKRCDAEAWKTAMEQELRTLEKCNVWKLVDRPSGTNVVSNKWVLKIKRKPDGTIKRYRARLVARGFSQIEGIDYHDTFAPVANITVLRLLFSIAAMRGLLMQTFDVQSAFLNGHLEEEVLAVV